MAETIWIHFALPRSAWYEQPEADRQELERQWEELRAHSLSQGATSDGRYHIRGQSDFSTVEVWRFPDSEAVFDHWQRLTAAGYTRWFRSANSFGARMPEER